MAKRVKPSNSVHRQGREPTPYKRIKSKVFNRSRGSVRESDFVDDYWVPLSDMLKDEER